MSGLFRTNQPFLESSAWQTPRLNALRYQTSQAGTVIQIVYGRTRVQFNLLDLANFFGPGGGKKGKKSGPLPITGTSNSVGKGGGKDGGGKKGGKKTADFSVDVSMGLCQGPVSIGSQNLVWAGTSIAFFGGLGMNFYSGADGQTGDPTFAGLGHPDGYSGTAYVTDTPMDLGSSPVLPNLSFEITGFLTGTATGSGFPNDANPGHVVADFLTNVRYGAGFPAALLDPNLNATYSDYCQAAGLLVSVTLDGQQSAAEWISGLSKLTNTAIVWSGKLLKFLPYGDVALSANDANWSPDLTWQYDLNDDDFLRWHSGDPGGEPLTNEDDPILLTRSNPADAINWVKIEYSERANSYNTTIIAEFDQGSIDAYGLRTGDNLSGKAFCNQTSAQAACRLALQRILYVRNSYKFKLGWKYALLEPMDIVLLTGRSGDRYLIGQPVRITSIEEDETGDLTIEAEEIQVGTHPTAPVPPVPPTVGAGGLWDPNSVPGATGGLPAFGILSNGNQDFSLPANGIFIFSSVATTTSHASGKWYFELTDSAGPDMTRVAVDLDARLMWVRCCHQDDENFDSGGADVGSGGTYLFGLGTAGFIADNAARIPLPSGSRVGATATSLSTGIPFGYPYSYWFNANDYHHLSEAGSAHWNDDLTDAANPATGVGGVDLQSLPVTDLFVCLSIECIVGPSNLMRIHTFTNGTVFPPPAGFGVW